MSDVIATRRSFLGGTLAIVAAAMVRAPAFESVPILHANGVDDDTEALRALFSGKPFRTDDGFCGIAERARLSDASLVISDTVDIWGCPDVVFQSCILQGKGPKAGFVFKEKQSLFLENCYLSFPTNRAWPTVTYKWHQQKQLLS